jgi:hypothetical protein
VEYVPVFSLRNFVFYTLVEDRTMGTVQNIPWSYTDFVCVTESNLACGTGYLPRVVAVPAAAAAKK